MGLLARIADRLRIWDGINTAAVKAASTAAAAADPALVVAQSPNTPLPAGTNAIGTVTANAGTNLNTSALALEAGGNLATLAGVASAVGGTTAPTKTVVVEGKTNDATPQYQPLPEGAGGRSVIVEGYAGGTAVPVSLSGNQAVNVAQLAGTTTSVNSGTKDAGTLRVVLATDQPQLTNKLLVTPDSVALPAHQSVNLDQWNGVAPTAAAALADGMSTPTAPAMAGFDLLYNGTTWDQQRNNIDTTLLASAARTSTTASADQTNYNSRGVAVFLNVTAASGTGGLQLQIQGKDPVSGNYVTFNTTPTAVTATGMKVYYLYPGASSTGTGITQATNEPLPRTWRVNVVHGDASSYTYSVGASVLN